MRHLLLFLILFGIAVSGTAQQTVGLFYADSLSYQGYTLWSPDGNWVYLIDNCGRKVHSWSGLSDPGAPPYLRRQLGALF